MARSVFYYHLKRLRAADKYVNEKDDNRVQYCDAYNHIDFGMPDGLHYDDETDQKILNFIARDCINYEG